jgi:hypothetical protein
MSKVDYHDQALASAQNTSPTLYTRTSLNSCAVVNRDRLSGGYSDQLEQVRLAWISTGDMKEGLFVSDRIADIHHKGLDAPFCEILTPPTTNS